MHFSLTTLYVKDMEASLAFYNGLLEMPLQSRMENPMGGDMAFLGEEGGMQLELIAAPAHTDMQYSGFSIGFDVEDLTETTERLKAAGYGIHRQFSPNPCITLAFLYGPSGEEVELIYRA